MDKFKVLVTDNISKEGIDILSREGNIDVEIKAGIKSEELEKIIGEYDAIITRSGTNIPASLVENPGKLKIIGRAGVGVDNIDIEAASKKGIIVMNAPTGNTLAATELTIGIMLAAARKIPLANDSLKTGKWNRKKFMGIELYNKTLGIVGLGRIGSNVAIRAKSFGMKIIAYDPYIKKSKADSLGVILFDNLKDLLKEVDVISFHTPLTAATRNMITAKEIELMKDNIIFVNCARGGIVNENDLYNALKSGKVFAAGVDVFEKEPPESNKLLELENVFATPHIGANTMEGQEAVSVIIAEQVANALNSRPYLNAINIPFMKSQLPDNLQLYFDLTEKMGKLAAQLAKGRPEMIQIVMVGKNFEEDLCERKFDVPFSFQPFTIAGLKGFLSVSIQESVTYINAPYVAKDRNIVVEETKTAQFDKFNDLIIFTLRTDQGEMNIAGTVFSDKLGRIVLLDRFHLDVIPKGTFLHFKIFDRPGIIGKVGTILGDHNINIAGFGVSRQKSGEELAFVSVDDPIRSHVLDEILKIDGMIEAKVIDL
ncbi:MAG TPA: phosphoglycerate dehydrogenase [Syntrophorhabdaceae bacterium]|mgnify:FL=1|jgi:D-3-phosphoglycerate dehydrogenase|nr:phosphoglycerate dehydrogenase [Syntrophorhabdaceae bacterium]HOS59365.1 phosphoglycerate dehydrogenase [Syntrophorhabdaceae bacterium]HQG50766.1 phosphoglycerate dehydrogenase [Syntrophorhabdaceae bacterium]HQI55924.1 phosphoglycerate dehydrogenase [Syntrophorhabdaceae bacterium]HQJ93419.1 phosphoglycerate dehydrogenase [Syntrophorhabdaceae bacterium]